LFLSTKSVRFPTIPEGFFVRGWILVSLLLFSAVFIAAASEDAQVAAAIGAALGEPTAPSASPGFVDGRLGDIQKRVAPIGRAYGPQQPPYGGPNYGPQGPQYGPNDGGYGGPGGEGYGPQGDDYGPGYGGPMNEPQDEGYRPGPQQPYGPQGSQPYGGPRDFRGYGGLGLPPEAVEGMIFSQIGDTLDLKYGKDNLLQKCDNQPELVNLILDEFQKSGVDLNEEICSPIEEGLAFCGDAKAQCEQIGRPPEDENGAEGEKPFVPSCPPDEAQLKAACVERFSAEWERQSQERLEEMEYRCAEQWDYRPDNNDACQDGKPRQPMECDKSAWIGQCLQNQPPEGDYGPGPQPYGPPQGQPYGPPQNQQPWMPPQGQQPQIQCPPMDENAKQSCLNNGQSYTSQTGPNGCPQIICQGSPQITQPPQGNTCPSIDENAHQQCTNAGNIWEVRTSPDGCAYSTCLPPAPTATATTQPTATAEPTASVTAGGYSELRLEDIPYNPGAGTYGGPQDGPQGGAGYGGGPRGGFGQPGKPLSASERCEQEWNRNSARFAQNCQRMQQQNRGPNFNFCNEQEFLVQCKAESKKQMEKDKQRMDPARQCERQVKRDLKQFERYCKDTQRGKEQCLKESERGCEFGKKQLVKCQELTTADNVKKAIERAVARECRMRAGRTSDLDRLRDSLPEDFRDLVGFESDSVADAQEKAKALDQKDVGYALTQLLGMQAEQERKDAQLLKEQSTRLGQTIERLKTLVEQVDSNDAKVLLQAQIADLEQQKASMDGRAQSKEQGASGIFAILGGLLGGK